MSTVGDMLDELEWPSLEYRREQSSLTFFYKIHSGMVYVDKDKYLTPVTGLRQPVHGPLVCMVWSADYTQPDIRPIVMP